MLKKVKSGENKKKTFVNVGKKNVADICHESNYYLCTLSHM